MAATRSSSYSCADANFFKSLTRLMASAVDLMADAGGSMSTSSSTSSLPHTERFVPGSSDSSP